MGHERFVTAAEFWDREDAAATFDVATRALPYEQALLERAVERVGGSGAVRSVDVLGVGGGRELSAVRAAAPHAAIRAIDLSRPMIERARGLAAGRGLEVELVVADLADVDARPGGADLIVGVNAVMCYQTPATARRRAWMNLGRLARPGGAMALVVQQRRGRLDWATYFAMAAFAHRLGARSLTPGDRVTVDPSGTGVRIHHYTRNDLRVELAAAGFADEEITSLRTWGRHRGAPVPARSPNPLVLTATRSA